MLPQFFYCCPVHLMSQLQQDAQARRSADQQQRHVQWIIREPCGRCVALMRFEACLPIGSVTGRTLSTPCWFATSLPPCGTSGLLAGRMPVNVAGCLQKCQKVSETIQWITCHDSWDNCPAALAPASVFILCKDCADGTPWLLYCLQATLCMHWWSQHQMLSLTKMSRLYDTFRTLSSCYNKSHYPSAHKATTKICVTAGSLQSIRRLPIPCVNNTIRWQAVAGRGSMKVQTDINRRGAVRTNSC